MHIMTPNEIKQIKEHVNLIVDIECYPNFFMVLFKFIGEEKYIFFHMTPTTKIDTELLMFVMSMSLSIGYNINKYDLYLIQYACQGYCCQDLKYLSDKIIIEKYGYRQLKDNYKLMIPRYFNTIDLFNLCSSPEDKEDAVASGGSSLKIVSARLGYPTIQELPIDPTKYITKEEMKIIFDYCIDDVKRTELVYDNLYDTLKIRYDLMKKYDVDVRSKSNAQCAEAIIPKLVYQILGKEVKPTKYTAGTTFYYKAPEFIKFQTSYMQSILAKAESAAFTLQATDGVKLAFNRVAFEVTLQDAVYGFGNGGLHSREHARALNDEIGSQIIDCDVNSYYPMLIEVQKLAPAHMGDAFLQVFSEMVHTRLNIKNTDKALADVLKILLNGTYGKLKEDFSRFYDPQLQLQVTLTGQLALLMLIESLTLSNIQVLSANTDGITCKVLDSQIQEYLRITQLWETNVGLTFEYNRYMKLYSRDVNNYFALTSKGKVKRIGIFKTESIAKNPKDNIVYEAVINLVVHGIPIAQTILECKDIKMFVTVTNVKTGATYDGQFIGKILRYYHAKDCKVCFKRVGTGNKVPDSMGTKPLLVMNGEIPHDLDYSYYINKSNELLHDIGAIKTHNTLF